MRHETFTIVYDGSAVADHTMDVRDLAPALLALSQIFDEAGEVLYGDKIEIKLHVRALEAGSFSIDMALVQSFMNQMKDLLNNDWVDATLNLKELIIGSIAGGGGLFWLIRKLKGKAPDRVQSLENGLVRIEIDNTTFDIPKELLLVYQDINIRRAAGEVISPLRKRGIDTISFKDNQETYEAISKDDSDYFEVPPLEAEEVLREYRRAAFSIVTLAFREDNKWRLHDGSNTIFATIVDQDFLRKVESNEISFRKSDVLICEVEDISSRDEQGLKTEHIVTKILEHKPAMRQIPFHISSEKNNDF